MNARTYLLMAAFVALHQTYACAERVRWEVADGGNGHWYEVQQGPLLTNGVHGALTWLEADAAARISGGHLATITSAAENAFVYALVDAPEFWSFDTLGNYFGPWLGGWQEPDAEEPAVNWRWVTGEPFDYANWHSGEPNDMFGYYPEDRIVFFAQQGVTGTRSPFWNDEMQNRRQPVAYVVEYVPEPATVVVLLAGLVSCRRHAPQPRRPSVSHGLRLLTRVVIVGHTQGLM